MRKNIFFAGLIAMLGVALLFGAMSSVQAAQPGPLAAPTPQSVAVRNSEQADALNFAVTSVMTAAGNSAALNVQNADVMDLQWVIDQTAVNTTTFKLQYSNDGENWVDGATFVTANAADANDMQQVLLFGKLARVNMTATNSNPFTVTLIGVAK